MKSKNLSILVVLAAALAVCAIFLHRASQPATEAAELGVLLPELSERVNDLSSLRVVQGEDVMEFARDVSGAWTAPAYGGFPVLGERVREALIQLVRLEKNAALTNRPEQWSKLQLDEPGKDSEARGVRLAAGDAVVAELVIGKEKWGAEPEVYARIAGEDQTWLCRGRLVLPREATDWMEKKVGSVPVGQIASVKLAHGEHALELHKAESGQWELEGGLPEGMALKTGNPMPRIAGALGWLSFDDVRRAGDVPHEGEPAFTATYLTSAEQEIVVRGWEVDGQTWCELRARYAATPREAAPEPTAEEAAESEAEEPAEPDPAEVVSGWNAGWEPWLYSFPATTLDLWKTTTDQIFEPAETADEALPEEAGDEILEFNDDGGGEQG